MPILPLNACGNCLPRIELVLHLHKHHEWSALEVAFQLAGKINAVIDAGMQNARLHWLCGHGK